MTQPSSTPASTSSASASRNAIPIATQEKAVMQGLFVRGTRRREARTLQYNPGP